MTWTCEQTEARLSDYLDGMLNPAEMAEFTAHVPACARCAPLVASVSDLLTGLHGMEQIAEPPRLVYSILDKTLGPRESLTGWRAILGWVRGVASIRFAYGALSVAATLIIIVTASGFNWRHPKLADLQPATIYQKADRTAHRAYGRSVKFVNDLRVVSEIQSRLREENDLRANPESTVPESSPQKQPGRSDGSKPATPRQQNRANDLARYIEVLAMEMPAVCGGLSGL
ncbi:MAG TPA: zf-HC2 domain-containing protein [Candidatus Acidoferrum sp.]|nr:zf-HC2 domain-containing protein [Candidatus Acidoferrum sp.]